MIPIIKNDSFMSMSSSLIMIGIQFFSFLIAVVVYYLTNSSDDGLNINEIEINSNHEDENMYLENINNNKKKCLN